ncbi:MAG: Flp pilus assembly protein CpaB [Rhizobiaceae bacterium]
MRGSTILSLIIALFLAVLAVIGAQFWLDAERKKILAANKPKDDSQYIVVAAEPLRFGERLSKSKVKRIKWPAGSRPAGSFTSITDVIGSDEDTVRFVMAAIETDEPVLANKITLPGQRAKLSSALSQGKKAVSIRVNDVLGVAGFVLPGDRVDIMLTRGRRDRNSYVDVLLQGVKVLAIDQIADDRKDNPSVVRTVTLEVSTAEAQKLTLAANVGTLSLALRNIASSSFESINRVTLRDLGGGEVSQSLAEEVIKKKDPEIEAVKEVVEAVRQQVESVKQEVKAAQQPTTFQPQPVFKPAYSIVGVTRGGKRQEYRFDEEDEFGQLESN